MKIELSSIFKENFKEAYLNTNKEPRRVVLLVSKDGAKTSMSYARYLMISYLNRFLSKEEHVDHIDGNRLNDSIENLQILSQQENNLKSVRQLGKEAKLIELICPICNTIFFKSKKDAYKTIHLGKQQCCSRKCGGKYSNKKNTN